MTPARFIPSVARSALYRFGASMVLAIILNGQIVSAQSQAPIWLPPLENLSAFRERPLFAPSRRPLVKPEPDTTAQASDGSQETNVELVGVISDETREGFALVRDGQTGEIKRVAKGTDFNGWILVSLSRHEAVFKRNDREIVLTMARQSTQPEQPATEAAPFYNAQ
jgi:general secretion pathway protein N